MALLIGLVGLVLSNLMRLQLGFPGRFAFIDAANYYQIMTMHGMIMVIYRMMVWATLAIGVLAVVVRAHQMFISGMNPYVGFFFATTTLIIAVLTAIKVYNWLLTL